MVSDGRARTGRWSYLAKKAASLRQVKQVHHRDLIAARPKIKTIAHRPELDLPPFIGGDLWHLAYEASDALEPLTGFDRLSLAGQAWPDLVIAHYENLWVLDHAKARLLVIAPDPPQLKAELADLAAALNTQPRVTPQDLSQGFAPETTEQDHQDRVRACVDRIKAGEIFQANLAQAWQGQLLSQVTPIEVFQALLQESPAPFNAYVAFEGGTLISNSPEQFIALDDGQATTSPIKGTRSRGKTAADDQALAQDLCNSPKDQAENLMIVDLMRNDLGRVCIPGSVKVPQLFGLESFANVHHLVSQVLGVLKPNHDALDLLLASFPPGSITGAPKLQAMKVIKELEAGPRGPFCGTLALFGTDGSLQSSVLIRTLAVLGSPERGWHFRAAAGGGITADSDPHDETLETEAKISRLRALLSPKGPRHD